MRSLKDQIPLMVLHCVPSILVIKRLKLYENKQFNRYHSSSFQQIAIK